MSANVFFHHPMPNHSGFVVADLKAGAGAGCEYGKTQQRSTHKNY